MKTILFNILKIFEGENIDERVALFESVQRQLPAGGAKG
jgi:hypothetical protein